VERTHAIDIDAPPSAVWAVWSDIVRWPAWTPGISAVEPLDPGPLAPGLRVRVRQPRLPAAVWRVTAVEPDRGFTWVSEAPGAHIIATHRIEPRGTGSRATLSIAYAGPVGRLVALLTRRITERYLRLEAEGLRAQSESHRAPRGPAAD
jgi:uncharacterized membrane protein